jgi:ubiquinone/menaquinone biosynthesis C-methylase UbiE
VSANYDKIASIYNLLSRLVYGKSIVKAQADLLKFIPPCSRILLVGGGTGWILEEIVKIDPEGLTIDYVESSLKMILLSQKKNHGRNIVHFINQPIENFSGTGLYDVIFTPFLFDNFREEKIQTVFTNLSSLLKDKGLWLHCDFVNNKSDGPVWQQLLLKTMYLFFRITARIETNELIPMENYFNKDYQKTYQAFYYAKFIEASVYCKN